MTDRVVYRSSSFCPEGQCVEVAPLPDGRISLRRSKDSTREPISFAREEWDAFVLGVLAGEFTFTESSTAPDS